MTNDEMFIYIIIAIGTFFVGYAVFDHLCVGFKDEDHD